MYCSLVITIFFSFFSMLLFKLTFEGCEHSLATMLSWSLYGFFTDLYDDKTFRLFLAFFNFFGKVVSHLMLVKGVPLKFYTHCYPVFKRYEFVGKSCILCSLEKMHLLPLALMVKKTFVNFMYSFSRLLGAVLDKHLGRSLIWFNLYGFFGVFLTVRLLFFVAFLFTLMVVVKYFSKLLDAKPFNKLVILTLVPSVLFTALASFLVYKSFFSLWYFVGSLVLTGVMFYTNHKHLRM
ncbi:conserved hypothetical protein [Theileria orientalis strain Shintoku]|uniref:Uncharacterized protein n=1 Tax=Theileria orientalis strain Shintoku TaxID=869250 RepID=J4C3L5_THEOR|nr:conserved hypothetical protein [Theileria orientalis strain Shintoku]BAM40651.1 conserved hypothetical protein [Theileria orientalis strain Shintoku]|eukprot:XP_009690952.1 conserved hypothetical protein [Theileria orientalis strain Shintoku]